MSDFGRLRITNLATGESQLLSEDDFLIEIDGEGHVSIFTPLIHTREFLLNAEELERAARQL